MYKVTLDKEKCVACGACTIFDNFKMNEDEFKAEVVDESPKDITESREAEESCPVYAIKVDKE